MPRCKIVALVMVALWATDCLGVTTVAISSIESAVVDHLWRGAIVLAGLAIVGRLVGPMSAAEQGAQLDPPPAGS